MAKTEPVEVPLIDPAIIAAAWTRHAQRVIVNAPRGCASTARVDCGEAMGRLGFNLAVMEIIECMAELDE